MSINHFDANHPLDNLNKTWNSDVQGAHVAGSFSSADTANKLKSDDFKKLLLQEVDDIQSIMSTSDIEFEPQEEVLLKDAKEWIQGVVEDFEEDEQGILVAVFGFLSDYPKPVVQNTLDKLLKLGAQINKDIQRSTGQNAQETLNKEKASGEL